MRGRTPTPTKTLQLRGSWRAKNRPDRDLRPPPGAPECPAGLSVDAKRCWAEVVRQLDAMELLSTADWIALEGLAREYADWLQARRALMAARKRGDRKRVREERANASDAWRIVQGAYRDLGLAPAARARVIPAPKQDKPGGKGRFFGKRTA